MSESHLDLEGVLRESSGAPYAMVRLRRLADEAGCRTGFETDEELLSRLRQTAALGRLGREGLFDNAHTGAWSGNFLEPGEAPDEGGEDEAPAARGEQSSFDLDEARQAATLLAAAEDGTPFCEECEKARQEQGAGA